MTSVKNFNAVYKRTLKAIHDTHSHLKPDFGGREGKTGGLPDLSFKTVKPRLCRNLNLMRNGVNGLIERSMSANGLSASMGNSLDNSAPHMRDAIEAFNRQMTEVNERIMGSEEDQSDTIR